MSSSSAAESQDESEADRRRVEEDSKADRRVKVLVLGFYDRGNAGDEMYRTAIPAALAVPEAAVDFEFRSMDDVEESEVDLERYSFVICGGGDIINGYFMKKARRLFRTYGGRIYAFSVGIPYETEAHYLNMFDHVFVRSRRDYSVASKAIGTRNVTYMPDAAMVLSLAADSRSAEAADSTIDSTDSTIDSTESATESGVRTWKLGVALAQPAFEGNPAGDEILDAIVASIVAARETLGSDSRLEVHLLAFNQHRPNVRECDLYLNERIEGKLMAKCDVVKAETRGDPMALWRYMSKLDGILSMRYHGVVFARTLGKPVVSLYTSKKVGSLLEDMCSSHAGSYEMAVDSLYRPKSCDAGILGPMLESMIRHHSPRGDSRGSTRDSREFEESCRQAHEVMFVAKKVKQVLVADRRKSGSTLPGIEEVTERCRSCLTRFLSDSNGIEIDSKGIEIDSTRIEIDSTRIEELMRSRGPFGSSSSSALTSWQRESLARLICYAITGSVTSPYLWGLKENMARGDFVMQEAIEYIHSEESRIQSSTSSDSAEEEYHPCFCQSLPERRIFVQVDSSPELRGLGSSVHRSGWAYAVSGLMSLDAESHGRSPEDAVLVDTYVDRTFHWGSQCLSGAGVIPYRRPWVGVIHHTFHESQSAYNCVELFKNGLFLESLRSCRFLVSLSQYLADQLRQALALVGHGPGGPLGEVRVETLRHPTLFPAGPEEKWSLEKFEGNRERLLLQVGSWLRDPWSLYECEIREEPGFIPMRKAALKGKDMDLYFPPGDLFEICERVSGFGEVGVNERNKFIESLLESLKRKIHGVQVLERVDDGEYDSLLASNVIWMSVKDMSAANVLLECLVRETPVLITRHAAAEEVLGREYPLYLESSSSQHEQEVAMSRELLERTTEYMQKVDKSQYRLKTFVKEMEEKIRGVQ